jgi:site-specific DNA-methyltransferase (adenine-specific)
LKGNFEQIGDCILYNDDCLSVIETLQDVDVVVTDPPYGTTACKWDSVIPLNEMWRQLEIATKPTAAIALTASQPFTSSLVLSNPKMFKHEWIWIKNRGSNFANTVREPMKEHESVLVFSKGKWTYNKQMQDRTGGGLARSNYKVSHNDAEREAYQKFEGREAHKMSKKRVPSSWQKFNVEVGLHPTQKPVSLMEYLIKTYSNEGDVVLDFTMGSGTTGVACLNLGRKFIGIEKDAAYFKTALDRIREQTSQTRTEW